MYFSTKIIDNQFDNKKADMMNNIVEIEQLLDSMSWEYWNPNQAPVSAGITWSKSMGVAWDHLADLRKYKSLPQLNEFINTAEDELDDLVHRFFKWANRDIIDAKTAADKYNRSTSTIYRWIKQGKIPAKKVNGRWEIIA